MTQLLRELGSAVRRLRRSMAFTCMSVLTLSVSIAAVASALTILESLDFRTIPVSNPATLAHVSVITPSNRGQAMSMPAFLELRRRTSGCSSVIGWYGTKLSVLELGGRFVRVGAWFVTSNFFTELGISPFAGRLFQNGDGSFVTGSFERVAVLGFDFWRRHGADATIVGRSITVDDEKYVVIGITPEHFTGISLTEEPDLTLPLMAAASSTEYVKPQSAVNWLNMGCRLRDGVSLDDVRAEIVSVWPAVKLATLPTFGNRAAAVEWLSRQISVSSAARGVDESSREQVVKGLRLCVGLTALLLLVACMNVACLNIARVIGQRRDIAIRLAIGASRTIIVGGLIGEALVISIVSAGAGLTMSIGIDKYLKNVWFGRSIVTVPLVVVPGVITDIVFGLAAVLISLIVASGAAAWLLRSRSIVELQKDVPGLAHRGVRIGLTLLQAQVALSLASIVCSGLLIRSFETTQLNRWRGANDDRVSIVELAPSAGGYKNIENDTYQPALVKRVSSLPGVQAVALTSVRPDGGAVLLRSIATETGRSVVAIFAPVSPGFMATLRLPVVRGRDFGLQDTAHSPRVAAVSVTAARNLFDSLDVVGQRLVVHESVGVEGTVEIVGVVGDADLYDARRYVADAVYIPQLQAGGLTNFKVMLVRSVVEGGVQEATVAEAVRQGGREVVVGSGMLTTYFARNTSNEQMIAAVGGFAAIAVLMLVASGILALARYMVERRRKDVAIRMALGATDTRLLVETAVESARIVLPGLVAGAIVAVVVARLIRSSLVNTAPTDVFTFAAGSGLLLTIVVMSYVAPLWIAVRRDAFGALKQD